MTTFRETLSAGATQLGICVTYPSAGAVERIGGEWDFVWIDGQHGQLDYQDMLALVRACDLTGTAALVRVPWLEAGAISQALDMAAAGVIVPCVDSVEEAKQAVAAAKFPPLGRRSYGGRRPIDRTGRDYAEHANRDQLLIVQIESPQAIEQADAIAAIEGVDALFLGPDDIMLRRGYSMQTPRSARTLGQDMQVVVDACRRHGKRAMSVGVGDEMLKLHLTMGFDLVVCGSDAGFLAGASQAAVHAGRALVEGAATKGGIVTKAMGQSAY